MPVRTVSAIAFVKVTESIGGTSSGLTTTATTVSADTDLKSLTGGKGTDGAVQLDFTISTHSITYSAVGVADALSSKETLTVRQHEYGHVGARNALASKTLLTDLCTDVGVKWTFHIPDSGNLSADQVAFDQAKTKYQSAVENYINPIVDYLDENVVHETQRTAQMVGRVDAKGVAAMLAKISYLDPVTGTTQTPSGAIMAKAITETKNGLTKGQNFAKGSKTPASL
jgi:hypothetical protein